MDYTLLVGESDIRQEQARDYTDKEKWDKFLKNIGDQWEYMVIEYKKSRLPYIPELEQILRKAKNGKSRLFNYCCTGFGMSKFEKEINKYNIPKMIVLAENISMVFDEPMLHNYPTFHLEYPTREKSHTYTYIEISEQQNDILNDLSCQFGIKKYMLQLIIHTWTLNAIYEDRSMNGNYEFYCKTGGYLNTIKASIKDYGERLKEHLLFAEYHMEQEIKVEQFKVENLYHPVNLLNEKIELLNKLRELT